ncbi:calcium-binding protein [Marinobacter confluentis]|uniref:Calcium-binding protein n=1 Tax=Marinobacter confluentis TaxID=1697557 RepID=A0A4Z1C532_9GAMM|nr:calcium-binding protein [Marinobacter confluentis]TGN38271.1 calcium-binding protein [Marinobacter confluentis]
MQLKQGCLHLVEAYYEVVNDSANETISFDEAIEEFGSFELVTGPDGESVRVFKDEEGRVAYIIRSGDIDRSDATADEDSFEISLVQGINLVTGALDYFTDELGRVLGTYQLQNTLESVEENQLPGGRLELEYIAEKSASELEALFQSDPAVRFALTKGNVYAIREDLAVYDSSELAPENFSDEYIRDRIRFMEALRFDSNEEDTAFRDLESGLSAGANPSSGLFGERVIFGSERDEVIEGSEFGEDKLYGGGGRDVLSGLGEDDHLEGNEGKDTLIGGAGDDILVGGEGNDQLTGGTGFDEYRFRPGDGADTVYDIDGLGRILIGDDTELVGTNEVAALEEGNTVWKSADGETVYTLVDGSLDEGTLEITGPGFEADDSITIQKFRNGYLGINLNPERDITLTPGDGGSSTTLVEGGARAFQLELNRPAEAGDRIVLSLGGEGADAVVARFGGDVLRFAEGKVTVEVRFTACAGAAHSSSKLAC